MKKTWMTACAAVLVLGVFTGTALAASLITDRELRRDYSDRVNRGLPKMVDAATRLERTSSGPRQLTYFYTLVGQAVADINVEEFEKKVAAQMASSLCSGGKMRNVLENKITVTYVYKDQAGQEIASIAITREACGM